MSPEPRHDRWFWAGLVVGGAIMANGVRGLFVNARATRPLDFGAWFFGSLVAHDFVVAPVVFVVGWAVFRVLGPKLRRVVVPAAVLSGMVLLFVWPLLRGYGARVDNPTLQPRDYVAGTVIVLSVIWLGAAAAFVANGLRRPPQLNDRPPTR